METLQTPLEIWRERLAHFEREEAKGSDPARRFTLRKEIEEARAKIAELEKDASKPPDVAPAPPRPKFDDAELDRHSRELTALYEEKRALSLGGDDTKVVDAEIRKKRRRLRRGPELAPGDRLLGGRFELVESLGKGGFGRVWKAWDEDAHRRVAVKVLFPQHLDERSKVERFFRGARWMAELRHANVVAIREPKLVDEDGWCFFVMELIDGPDLERAVLGGGLSRADGVRIVRRVGEALEHAHAKGLVHRDVKPSNVLLDADLEPKLTDFDLVRADDTDTPYTATHAMMGTLNFAAPELLHSPRDAGPAADVYALGTTAIFVLRGEALPAGYYLNPGKAVAELDIPKALAEVLRRATSHEADDRYPSAGAFTEAFARAAVEEDPPDEVVVGPTVVSPQWTGPSEDLFRWIETPHDGRVELWREIPAGTFRMGSPEGVGHGDEHPQHRVTIHSAFRMAAVPVTNAQYAAFDAKKGEEDRANHPVVHVTWHDAMKFCEWLSSTAPWARGVRLPTEEEWEYACRAGTETAYWNGDKAADLDRVGWTSESSGHQTHAVGEKPANAWGLYDVHGNVWEWTLSPWTSDYSAKKDGFELDPRSVDRAAASGGGQRVIRGGGYGNDADYARAACRGNGNPDIGRGNLGFRLLLPPAPPESGS